ncbi:MAG: ABC transporter substrate-binding protein [Bacteroidetes bacterium]|nr:MAG: ABC transporter substrate-binding protein [Bacteroidota bacterium]
MRNLLRVIHIFFLLAACSRPDAQDAMVFRYNQETSIQSLDPAFAKDQANIRVVNQLFSTLIEFDSQLNIIPGIAESWSVEDSGKLYRFYLRRDAFFHKDPCMNERVVTAQDFIYSFERIIDPKLASPGTWIFNGKLDSLQAFSAPDSFTLEIRLQQAFPPFLGMLGMPYCAVVPHEAIETYGADFRKHPVGSGPFAFEYWEEGVRLILKKHPNYYEVDEAGESLPYLNGIIISFIENKQTAFLEFVQGKADYFSGLEGSFKDELLSKEGTLRPKYAERFSLRRGPYLNTEYFGFFLDSSIQEESSNQLLNKSLRKAISFAVNRDKMMRYLRNNIGIPGNGGFIPAGLPGNSSTSQRYAFNPDSVRFYLKQAGYPNGDGLEPIVLYTNKNYTDLTVFIQKSLEEFGIRAKIEVNPGPFHRERVSKGQLPFFRASWLGDYPDAENYLALFYGPNKAPLGPNYTHYQSARFDSLYKAAMLLSDLEERSKVYRSMDELAMEDAPVLVLFYDQTMVLVADKVQGLPSNAMNSLILKRVKFK